MIAKNQIKVPVPTETRFLKNKYPAYAANHSDDGKKNQLIQVLL